MPSRSISQLTSTAVGVRRASGVSVGIPGIGLGGEAGAGAVFSAVTWDNNADTYTQTLDVFAFSEVTWASGLDTYTQTLG